MTSAGTRLLGSDKPREVVRELDRVCGELIKELDDVVPRARKGNQRAVRSYVHRWREMERAILRDCAKHQPDLVVETAAGLFLVDVKGRPSPDLTAVLDQEALHAPFSPWGQLGDGVGVGLHLVASLRRLVGRPPLRPPAETAWIRVLAAEEASLNPNTFLRCAVQELESAEPPLERVGRTFELSDTGFGRLFDVSRQRIAQWRDEGVPVTRMSKLNTLSRIADVLEHQLIPNRIPGVVREKAKAFRGRSMLDLIAEDRQDEVLKRVEESFDWARTA